MAISFGILIIKREKTSRLGVGWSVWLDLFGFHLPLCIILEYPPGATKEKGDNDNANERARRRMRDEPRIKLQDDNEDDHGDDCEATAAENEKREDAGNSSYDDAEPNCNCGD